MGGVVDFIAGGANDLLKVGLNPLGLGGAVGKVADKLYNVSRDIAPEVGTAVGSYFGGPWGAALGSAAGEALKGGRHGSLSNDLTAGALAGIGSYAGGELFGGAGGAASGDTIDALGSSGATDYLGSGIGDLYGQAPVQVTAGSLGSAGGAATGGGGIGDVLGSFNAAGASNAGSGLATGAAGAGGASATDTSGTNWWQSLGGGGTSATPDTSALTAGGAPGGAQSFGQLTGPGGAPLGAGVAGGSAPGGTGGISGIGGQLMDWVSKHPAAAAQLGMAAYGATQKPQLPSALKTLQGTAQSEISGAQSVISSGGTSSPNWNQQKTTIDQTVDQQVKEATQALLQRAANSGLDPNSMVVQQQIAQLNQQATTQKNGLYQQALQQNVSEAMNLLSGGSSALAGIGQAQLQSDQSAQQLVAQLAGNALRTSSLQGQTPQSLPATG